jgi:hypothetical protein
MEQVFGHNDFPTLASPLVLRTETTESAFRCQIHESSHQCVNRPRLGTKALCHFRQQYSRFLSFSNGVWLRCVREA